MQSNSTFSEAHKRVANILTDGKLTVTQQGGSAFIETDDHGVPTSLNIPSLPDDASEALKESIAGWIDHEVAHYLKTDFASAHGLEGVILSFFNAVEDTYVEREITKIYRGSQANLGSLNALYLQRVTEKMQAPDFQMGDELTRFGILGPAIIRAMAGQRDYVEFMRDKLPLVQSVYDKIKDLSADIQSVKCTNDSIQVAKSLVERLELPPPPEEQEQEQEEEKNDGGGNAPEEGGERESAPEESALSALGAAMAGAGFDETIEEAINAMADTEIKESDYVPYTTDYDVIEKIENRADERDVAKLEAGITGMIGVLQKDLERAIASMERRAWEFGHSSGRINPSALHTILTGNERVFRRRMDITGMETAVQLFVDCSGSMRTVSEGHSRINVAVTAAYVLAKAFDRLNIPCEVIGFTTGTDRVDPYRIENYERFARFESIRMLIYKDFSERFNSEVTGRFAYMATSPRSELRNNIDGESLIMAASRLAARKERRKILLSLSDGNPMAALSDAAVLRGHLKKSVERVRESGIDIAAVGIQTDAPKHYYDRCMTVSNIDELPEVVIGELKKQITKH